jgi:pimeloyl-ACP methyl ester carboxylesterase
VEQEKGAQLSCRHPIVITEVRTLADLPINFPGSVPVLFLQATQDSVCIPSQVERMKKWVPQLTVESFDCGHWILVEKKEEVNKAVVDWLARITPNIVGAKL